MTSGLGGESGGEGGLEVDEEVVLVHGLVSVGNYLTNLNNQHAPSYCGSYRAPATTSATSDIIKAKSGFKSVLLINLSRGTIATSRRISL